MAVPVVKLHRLEPDQGERYLGVRMTIEGSWKDEFNYRLAKQKKLAAIRISEIPTSRAQAFMIHQVQYCPSIKYALQHTQFSVSS